MVQFLLSQLLEEVETRETAQDVHFVYEFVEFVIVLGHGQSPILSNKPLDKLEVTQRDF